MNKLPLSCVTAIAILVLPGFSVADDSLAAGLENCAAIADDTDRLVCFDALASNKAAPPAIPAVAEVATTQTTPVAPAAPPTAAAELPQAVPDAAAAELPQAVPDVAPAEVVPLSDDVGKSSVKRAEAPKSQKYSTRVTRCVENKQSGQYYFYFDNGQVWKQSKYRRLRWKECEFDVIVTKGIWGYEMYIPEKDRTIRISRLR